MASPIFSLQSHMVTLRRFDVGSYVNGKYVAGAANDISLTCSLQPMEGNETKILPEGVRESQTMKMYTVEEIRTSNQEAKTKADEIIIDGLEFEVYEVQKWTLPSSPNAHYKSILFKKNDESGTQ